MTAIYDPRAIPDQTVHSMADTPFPDFLPVTVECHNGHEGLLLKKQGA